MFVTLRGSAVEAVILRKSQLMYFLFGIFLLRKHTCLAYSRVVKLKKSPDEEHLEFNSFVVMPSKFPRNKRKSTTKLSYARAELKIIIY